MTEREHFTLCETRITVLEFGGTVQLLFWDDCLPEGKQRIMSNRFAGPETASELRAIADHLDAMAWPDAEPVAGAA